MKLTIITLAIILFSCEHEKAPSIIPAVDSSKNLIVEISIPEISDEVLKEIFDLQLKVNRNPTHIEFRKQLIARSYFMQSNTLITFGCARKSHPKSGQQINLALLKRAATIDANRWAAYSTEWINNNYMPDFGKLNSNFNGMNQQISSFDYGDSLVIAFAYKINE